MKRLLFIFNPLAGKAKIHSYLSDIISFYSSNEYLVTMYCTQCRGDGSSILKKIEHTYDLLVCCGGDGTLNEVISGILDSGFHVPLGYIPFGSTNDFGKSIGIPMDIFDAMDTTLHGKSYAIDIGRFNQSYFTYVAAFGIFTNVPYNTPQKMKNALGYLAYVLEGIKAISDLKSYKLSLEHDQGITEGNFIVGLITNTFSVCGIKPPFHALTALNDGIFEVLLIRTPQNILELQSIVSALLSERIDPSSLVIYIRTSTLKIYSEPMDWTFDGEYGGRYEYAQIYNLNKAITIKTSSPINQEVSGS